MRLVNSLRQFERAFHVPRIQMANMGKGGASSGAVFGSHAAPAASTRCERKRTQRAFSPPAAPAPRPVGAARSGPAAVQAARNDEHHGTSESEVVRQAAEWADRSRVKVESAANLDAAKGMRTGGANGLRSTRDNQWVAVQAFAVAYLERRSLPRLSPPTAASGGPARSVAECGGGVSSGALLGSHAAPAASIRCERKRTQGAFSPPAAPALTAGRRSPFRAAAVQAAAMLCPAPVETPQLATGQQFA